MVAMGIYETRRKYQSACIDSRFPFERHEVTDFYDAVAIDPYCTMERLAAGAVVNNSVGDERAGHDGCRLIACGEHYSAKKQNAKWFS